MKCMVLLYGKNNSTATSDNTELRQRLTPPGTRQYPRLVAIASESLCSLTQGLSPLPSYRNIDFMAPVLRAIDLSTSHEPT